MRLRSLLTGGTMFVVAAAQVHAQDDRREREREREREEAVRERVRVRAPRAFSWSSDDDQGERPIIGVGTSTSGGRRDTLGLLVTSVTPGGPAEKAGIEEGARIVAINGTSLRLSAADAGEPDMAGIPSRRLTREIRKGKAGDEVELRVWQNGATRTLKLKTIAAEDLRPERITRADMDDRAVLGIALSATGTRRDTLGVFVSRVQPDGPAEKAGLVEGDRIAAINGVDLRVSREDAGDDEIGSAKSSRFTREMRKVKAGQDVELRVHSGGATKTLRVKAGRNEDVYDTGRGGWVGFGEEGGTFFMPRAPMPPAAPMPRVAPRVRVFRDGYQAMGPEIDGFDFEELGRRLGELGPAIGQQLEMLGPEIGARMSLIGPEINDRVREALDRVRFELPEGLQRLEGLERLRWQDDEEFDDASDDEDAVKHDDLGRTGVRAKASSPVVPKVRDARALEAENRELVRKLREAEANSLPRARMSSASLSGTSTSGTAAGGSPAARACCANSATSATYNATAEGDRFSLSLPGLRLAPVSSDLAAYLGAGSERGLLVVEADARWSGIREGDVLLTIDGKPVTEGRTATVSVVPGRAHAVALMRGGTRQSVTLAAR